MVSTVLATFQLLHALFSHQLVSTTRRSFVVVQDVSKPLEIMGQYYKFVNTTKKSESTIPLPFNFNLPYAKSLENYSREELREKFDYVIQNNNWNKEDVVIAIGDYEVILYYPED